MSHFNKDWNSADCRRTGPGLGMMVLHHQWPMIVVIVLLLVLLVCLFVCLFLSFWVFGDVICSSVCYILKRLNQQCREEGKSKSPVILMYVTLDTETVEAPYRAIIILNQTLTLFAVLLSYFSLRFQTTKMPNLVLEEPVWEARDAMLLLLPFFMSYLYEFNHSWITGGLWKAWLSPNCLQLGGGTSLTALGQYGLSSSFTQQDMKGIFHSSDVMCHSN